MTTTKKETRSNPSFFHKDKNDRDRERARKEKREGKM
jgi:hypothetical protein